MGRLHWFLVASLASSYAASPSHSPYWRIACGNVLQHLSSPAASSRSPWCRPRPMRGTSPVQEGPSNRSPSCFPAHLRRDRRSAHSPSPWRPRDSPTRLSRLYMQGSASLTIRENSGSTAGDRGIAGTPLPNLAPGRDERRGQGFPIGIETWPPAPDPEDLAELAGVILERAEKLPSYSPR